MPLYREVYLKGTLVRVADRASLLEFQKVWKLHHPLRWWQLWFAGQRATVFNVGFYHGGDVLYQLRGVPGTWHECCLRSAD
jgi:hypothetical protein